MDKLSRILLRLPAGLHRRLREIAKQQGLSLNQYLVDRLEGKRSEYDFAAIRKVWGSELVGVIQFGSSVRGEMRAGSDVDLLMVMAPQVAIDRSLYRRWDKEVAPHLDRRVSPQFAKQPESLENLSGLWLEVGLEGIVHDDSGGQLRRTLNLIRDRIAKGEYRRSVSHGHPYWVNLKDSHNMKEQSNAEPRSGARLRVPVSKAP